MSEPNHGIDQLASDDQSVGAANVPNQSPPIPDAALTMRSLAAAIHAGRTTPEAAAEALRRARPFDSVGGYSLPGTATAPPPPPTYTSWADWCGRTSVTEKRRWCRQMAKGANRQRLLSGSPTIRISAHSVWAVLETAQGRCRHCGSLAVERRPSGPDGRPIPWANVGRRIGSLGHLVPRFEGGDNEPQNLVWSCLWCNTWKSERRVGAADHGGHYPKQPGATGAWEPPYPPAYIERLVEAAAARASRDDEGDVEPDLDAAADGEDPYWYLTRD